VQTLTWWTRSIPLFERCRARYGKRFTLRLLQSPPLVHLSDPAEVKEVFRAPPDVLHPGEGAKALEPVVGANSVILLDESAHLRSVFARAEPVPTLGGTEGARRRSITLSPRRGATTVLRARTRGPAYASSFGA
jgi:hypothetical protein